MATSVHSTNIVAYPTVQQPATIVPTNVPRMNVAAVRGLGITQIIIGVLTIIFGIASIAGFEYTYWVNSSGSGIWFGIWILATGIIGFSSSRNPSSGGLNGTNMGFNIVCSVVSFFVGIFYIVAVAYYSNCREYSGYDWYRSRYYTYCKNRDAGIAVYSLLLVAMIGEFVISIIAAVYCCQGGCCGGPAVNGGVIIQTQQPGFVTTGVITSSQYQGYPAGSYPQPVQAGAYPVSTMYPASTMQAGQPAGYPQYTHPGGMPATNITYSTDQQKTAPPPPYAE